MLDDAQVGVEVREEVDRVAREVGEEVVFDGVDVGRVQVRRCRTAEGDAERGHGRVYAVDRHMEAFQHAAGGGARVSDQHERHVVAGYSAFGQGGHQQR